MNRNALPAFLAVFLFASVAFAGERRAVYAPGGVALGGVDPVSYFTKGGPEQGREDVALMWRGVVWLFASPENRALFEMNPHHYAPAYGGFCAMAMSEGYAAGGDPEAWAIHGDRLYLIYSRGMKEIWERNIEENVEKANENWKRTLR